MIAERVRRLGFSPTLRISGLARELRAAGEDVLDFSAGQPDFPTPDDVKEAGRRAIAEDQTRYTANEGLVELREAIAGCILRDHAVRYPANQILVSSGAKASLYFACMALVDPGDEVLVPTPYWVSYPEQVRLAQGEPVFIPCDEADGFKLRVDRLEAALTTRTHALMLNYPSNPTGACYTRDELVPIARFCVEHDLWLIADEIYSRLLFDGRTFASVVGLGDDVVARTIMIDGVSKSFSMTGWRIGWAAGPREAIAAMAKVQSHSTSNASTISQWATVQALGSPHDEAASRAAEFQARRDVTLELLAGIPGVSCVPPAGSFYAFPNVSSYFRKGGPSCGADVAEMLLREAKVAVVPGDAFGAPEHIRISFAVEMDRIREGMARIRESMSRLVVA